MESSP